MRNEWVRYSSIRYSLMRYKLTRIALLRDDILSHQCRSADGRKAVVGGNHGPRWYCTIPRRTDVASHRMGGVIVMEGVYEERVNAI